ncbi:olfactory receptor 8S1 [Equus quagga]|uniref:olfactory receptor 8S1 n=1 Tax=Equus quagga TaxID=89248 RepID=UPI001EE39DD6|nr:olfactory receptor 8S1 [Equus quagga]
MSQFLFGDCHSYAIVGLSIKRPGHPLANEWDWKQREKAMHSVKSQILVTGVILSGGFSSDVSTSDGKDRTCGAASFKKNQENVSKKKTISLLECFTQISLVILSGAAEACLLTVMAYDRFQAVCHPLLYIVAMNRKVCTGLVGASWAIGMGTGLVNTILLAQQHFCGPNLVHSFACELPPVLPLACSDPHISIATILTTMVVLGLGTFVLSLGSYTRIITTALRINSATGRSKIFSTCSSHFLVVTIFYGSGIFRYMTPASGSALEQVLSVQYSVVTPLLNPLIYSLKNQEVKAALRRMLARKPRLTF